MSVKWVGGQRVGPNLLLFSCNSPIPCKLAPLGTIVAAPIELMSVLIGLKDHDPTAQRTGHLDFLPISILQREYLLEENGLMSVL